MPPLSHVSQPIQCQKSHWKIHKKLCKHIRAHRSSRMHSSELEIRPWGSHTTYEQKDADFAQFERVFEKNIARFAKKHSKDNTEAGVVCVDISRQKKPLHLWWCPIEKLNSPGMPYLVPPGEKLSPYHEMVVDIRTNTLKVFPKTYVCMVAWGGQNPMDWNDCPINHYTYGGRGSREYTGPVGFHTLPDELKAKFQFVVS